MRALGGVFFLSGMVLMCYNMFKTIKQGSAVPANAAAAAA
jgi:cytochrome c oxidase cbb3-type subunit 1